MAMKKGRIDYIWNSQKTPQSLPVRASSGASIVSILEDPEFVITRHKSRLYEFYITISPNLYLVVKQWTENNIHTHLLTNEMDDISCYLSSGLLVVWYNMPL